MYCIQTWRKQCSRILTVENTLLSCLQRVFGVSVYFLSQSNPHLQAFRNNWIACFIEKERTCRGTHRRKWFTSLMEEVAARLSISKQLNRGDL